MSTTQQDQTIEKPRQRGRKAGKRGAKVESPRDGALADAIVASQEVAAGEPAVQADQPLQIEQPAIGEAGVVEAGAIEEAAAVAAAPAETARVNAQTIADACRDYTRKSLQENRRFVEQLMGVRTFDKAVAAQADYARQTYTDFVAQSQRIYGLYRELARQSFKPRKN